MGGFAFEATSSLPYVDSNSDDDGDDDDASEDDDDGDVSFTCWWDVYLTLYPLSLVTKRRNSFGIWE